MTKVEIIFVFLSGFATCAVVLGTLWFLRECERARTFKAIRNDNDRLRDKDLRSRLLIIYLREGLGETRNLLGGRVALPSSSQLIGQHSQIPVKANSAGPSNGGPRFSGGSNEQR
jgi:hypothetical protein